MTPQVQQTCVCHYISFQLPDVEYQGQVILSYLALKVTSMKCAQRSRFHLPKQALQERLRDQLPDVNLVISNDLSASHVAGKDEMFYTTGDTQAIYTIRALGYVNLLKVPAEVSMTKLQLGHAISHHFLSVPRRTLEVNFTTHNPLSCASQLAC